MNAVIIEQLKRRIAELEPQEPALYAASIAADKAYKESEALKEKNKASDAWVKVIGELSTLKNLVRTYEATPAIAPTEVTCQS